MSDNPPADRPTRPALTCPRRQVLMGAGLGGVVLVAAACGSSSSGSTTSGSGSGSSSAPSGSASGSTQGIITLSKVPSNTSVSVNADGKTLLITQSGGTLTALDATCTHQGCTVAPDGGQLACPCHGSQFTLTGAVTQGPATVALHKVAVKIEGDQVVLA